MFFVLLTRASIGFRSDLKELVIGSNIKVELSIVHKMSLSEWHVAVCIRSSIQAFRYIKYRHLNGLHRGIKGASGWIGVGFCHGGLVPFRA